MQLESIKLSKKLIKTILVETLSRGKSLNRILVNHVLAEFELSGQIIDLGSGSDSASYNRFLRYKNPYKVTYSDLYREGQNLIKINLEKPFEIGENSFDYVMCFNVLEHIYNFKNVIKESHRILRTGGVFIGSTPFMHRFHPDPCDYFRYSHQALVKMFEEESYVCEKIVYVGFGPFSIGGSQWTNLAPKTLRAVLVLLDILNVFLDIIFIKFSKSYRMVHPFSYVYVFRKA